MTRILAIDLGTSCGWAHCDPTTQDGPDIQHGTFDLKPGKFAGGGRRFVKFREELSRFVDSVDEVWYEGVRRHHGVNAAHIYGGLMATLTAWCEEQNIPYDAKTVQAIKIFATGKGNADKSAVISAVEQWGFKPKTDDEADAIALLRLRLSEIQIREPVVPPSVNRRRLARGTNTADAVRPAESGQDTSSDPRFG